MELVRSVFFVVVVSEWLSCVRLLPSAEVIERVAHA